jgi:hypothetical protein
VIRFGTHRFWCPETINEVIGIDHRHVAVRGHSSLFVYDRRTGLLVEGVDARSVPCGEPAMLRVDVGKRHLVKVSPDGRWAAAANFGSRVRVFDNETGAMQFPEDPEHAYSDVAFSADGSQVVGTANGAYAWSSPEHLPAQIPQAWHRARFLGEDIVGGAIKDYIGRWRIDGHERARVSIRHKVEHMSWTADARRVAVSTVVTGGLCIAPMPDVVVADVTTGRAVLRFHDDADITRGAYLSPDGKWLALSDENGVRLCDASPRAPWLVPPVLQTWPHGIVLADRDRALRTTGGAVDLVTLPDGEVITRVASDGYWSWSRAGFCEVTLDQRRLRVRDPQTLAIVRELGFDFQIDAFAISPDGKRIALTDEATLVVDYLTAF